MMTQRAVRRLLPDPVDDVLVLKCIELALRAPTGNDGQNVGIHRRQGRPDQREARQAISPGVEDPARCGAAARNAEDESMAKIARSIQWQIDHFTEIPVLVVACLRLGARDGRLPFVRMPHIAESAYWGSIYPSVQNLLLAARAMGLGASLITLPLWSQASARRILGLPRSVTPCCIVPLGWPRGRYGPTTRKPVEEVAHRDAYGNRTWLDTFERPVH